MQKINTERQLVSDRLQRHLPGNTIREIEKPIHHKRVNQISQSAPSRSDRLTSEKRQLWPSRRLQTDFDIYRSLSSCPTYSSLSRHSSPGTRNCATQITTLTPPEIVEKDQDSSSDSSLSIDNKSVLLVEENPEEDVEFMPISSGAGYYPYNYPTTRTDRVMLPQIVLRANQFRDRNQYGFNGQFGAKSNGKTPRQRPTAVKHPSPRSDTYALPTRRNEVNNRVLKDDYTRRNGRRTPPPPDDRRAGPARKKDFNLNFTNNHKTSFDEDKSGRPLYPASNHNGARRTNSPSLYNRKARSLPRNDPQYPRRIRRSYDDYITDRRRQPSHYVYDDYLSDDEYGRRGSRRFVRVVRESPRRYHDEADYPESSRRPLVLRRVPRQEYVIVDEADEPPRRSRSRRSDVVYVEDDRPVQYEDEYIYVDEHGNEVQIIDDRSSSRRRYAEYDDEDYRRRPKRKDEVVYVGDDPPTNSKRDHSKSRKPASKRIVYD